MDIIYENDELMVISRIGECSNMEEIRNYQYLYDETSIIEDYIGTDTDNYVVSYNVEAQKYSWSNKILELLDIDNTEDFSNRNLIKEFIVKEDLLKVRELYKEITPENPVIDYDFRILTQKNNLKYIHCNLFAIYDNNDYLKKVFYFFTDKTENKIIKDNLNILTENLEILERSSRSAFYYKNANGKYQWSSNICNIVDCPNREAIHNKDIINELVLEEDREILEKFIDSLSIESPTANFKIRIISRLGILKYLNIFIKNVYDSEGNFEYRNMQVYDVSDMENIQTDLSNLINTFNSVDYNLKTGLIYENYAGKLKVSKMFNHVIGVYRNWSSGGREQFIENLINKNTYLSYYEKFMDYELDQIHLLLYYKFDGYDDDIRIFEYFLKRKNNTISGYIRDISTIKDTEMELKILNNQKSMLIKEIHHRVKNNLQVLSSLLNLEERFYEDAPNEIIDATKKRIKSMALIHELTYNSHILETVNIKKYFDIYDEEMGFVYDDNHIKMKNDISEDINFSTEIMTPLVLIINEFMSNSIKYAFNDENDNDENIISKSIRIEDGNCIVEYKDNGVGLPEDYDIYHSNGLGWTIIISLISQLDGTLEEIESDGIGFRFTFPINR
ncbi:MAG: sensor histidine kinase [Methanobrevibacter sp.]|uniref:PAS domain-containing sensor histidine kinase n=1 Tax=Methanobrevibacter sp. TaxID=66852 RepID=UPI0026DED071|nr:sensor histidine kinase [Methanobrevibacter sp.]MDO5849404.1 sensor histidine kinase [Methanobrevibacter sp.]